MTFKLVTQLLNCFVQVVNSSRVLLHEHEIITPDQLITNGSEYNDIEPAVHQVSPFTDKHRAYGNAACRNSSSQSSHHPDPP